MWKASRFDPELMRNHGKRKMSQEGRDDIIHKRECVFFHRLGHWERDEVRERECLRERENWDEPGKGSLG